MEPIQQKIGSRLLSECFHLEQSWTYSTRQGEVPSRAIVCRIDKTPVITIIHAALTDVLIRGRAGEYRSEIGHLPFSAAAFAKSVREVMGKNAAAPDGFEKG